MSTNYYIGTGALNCYYTLRYRFEEPVYERSETGVNCVGVRERDYHVRNLSIDREEAVRKAREITGAALDASFDVRPIGERLAVDPSIMPIGKYEGKSVYDIAESDPEYLCWFCENVGGARHAETVALAKALMAHRLAERDAARKAEADTAAAKAVKVVALLKPVADALKAASRGSGDFCDSVGGEMLAGRLPMGRAVDIALDVYAKGFGRRGSKAYDAAYDEACGWMDAAEAV